MRSQPILTEPLLARVGRSARRASGGVALFDDVAVQVRVTAHFLTVARSPLVDTHPPAASGAYALWFHGDHAFYEDLDGASPLYVGKGAYLPERISSHRASITEVHDLDVADFSVAWLATSALHHAEVVEHLLNGAFCCRWNQREWSGFGSRPRGSGRSQKPTRWDRKHPGRTSRTRR